MVWNAACEGYVMRGVLFTSEGKSMYEYCSCADE